MLGFASCPIFSRIHFHVVDGSVEGLKALHNIEYCLKKLGPTLRKLAPHFKHHNVLASLVVPKRPVACYFYRKRCCMLSSLSLLSLLLSPHHK
jgi:hypothetical protein